MDFWNSATSLPRLLSASRSYLFWWVFLFVGYHFTISAQEPAQTTHPKLQFPPANDSPQEMDPAIFDEIIAVREQLGGGLGKTLSGLKIDGGGSSASSTTIGDSSHTLEFAEALASVASAKQPLIRDPSRVSDKPQSLAILPINGILAVEPSFAVDQEIIKFPSPRLQESQKSRVCLRQVARQLDQLAADLEDVQQYQHADNLRNTATMIRRQVRISDSTSSETTDPWR